MATGDHFPRKPRGIEVEVGATGGANLTLPRESNSTAAEGRTLRGLRRPPATSPPAGGIGWEAVFEVRGCRRTPDDVLSSPLRCTTDAIATAALPPRQWVDPAARIPAEVERAAGTREIAPSAGTSPQGNRGSEQLDEREWPNGVVGGDCDRPGLARPGCSTWNTLMADEGTRAAVVPRETCLDCARPPAHRPRWYRRRQEALPAGVAASCGRQIATAARPAGRFARTRVCRMITLRPGSPPRSDNE